jgi:adenine C2-methylase RlmN of 23S rRNA A2503 and tRNA A37
MEPFIFGNVLEKSKPTASNDLKVSSVEGCKVAAPFGNTVKIMFYKNLFIFN